MEKPFLECPACAGSNFHLHEITIADPQTTADAEASSAIVICTDCNAVVGALLPPYPPPKPFKLTTAPVAYTPYQEGAYGEGSC